jgi:atypical dual specificity phosphatase
MPQPEAFSWIERPLLAAMGQPGSAEEIVWLRDQGIELLVCLAEDSPPRRWVNEAGLFLVHVPIQDYTAPTPEQLEQALSNITRAQEKKLGVGVCCGAGLGRTGTILACYFVTQGLSAKNAIARVRRLRPGSIETEEQEKAVEEFEARRLGESEKRDE